MSDFYNRPNACSMPTPAEPREATIYRGIRDTLVRSHCSAKRDHLCCGAITITRQFITFNCPLCGDLRHTIVEGVQ